MALPEDQLLARNSDGGGHDGYAVSQQRRKDSEASQGAGSGVSAPVQRRISAPIQSGISTPVQNYHSVSNRARKGPPMSGEQFATKAWCVLKATLGRSTTGQARLFSASLNIIGERRAT